MRTECFAYRSEKHKDYGIEWKREYCDALEDPNCDRCPFYKHKDTVRMKIVRKQTQYEDLR